MAGEKIGSQRFPYAPLEIVCITMPGPQCGTACEAPNAMSMVLSVGYVKQHEEASFIRKCGEHLLMAGANMIHFPVPADGILPVGWHQKGKMLVRANLGDQELSLAAAHVHVQALQAKVQIS